MEMIMRSMMEESTNVCKHIMKAMGEIIIKEIGNSNKIKSMLLLMLLDKIRAEPMQEIYELKRDTDKRFKQTKMVTRKNS